MFNKYKYIFLASLVLFMVLFLKFGCNKIQAFKDLKSNYETISEQVKTYKNKNGELVGQIGSLETQTKKQFLSIKSKDSTIQWLQQTVKDYKGKLESATVASTSTTDSGSTGTVVTKWDTIVNDSVIERYPTYETLWRDKWSTGRITANNDSIVRNIKIRNEYEFTQGYERKFLFWNSDKLTVEMTNKNPNTITNEVRTVTFKDKPRLFSIGVGFAYGYDLLDGKRTVIFGVNGSFTIVRF